MLVQFENTSSTDKTKEGKGCCPGQTGHHLLSSAMFSDCSKSEYKASKAPTICVEGAYSSNGSHGMIHRNMRDNLGKLEDAAGNKIPYNTPITKKQAIDEATKSVEQTFPTAGCDPKCIRAQLNEFYKDLDCTPKSHPGG
ncbi:HNH/endonuclease VII fold toxin-2 domain-containing protein [Chitinibacter sp. FCG-7]|uniref:HNH/endonuclease VII fold toxin-2 domain-containing protein n=1 Tax=Chitinibacter mangrovi TaxID=3153927 RepID=A0AAU7FCJ5_9NEIS